MKAICPSDKNHKEFITCAHVMQDWKVDERGQWIETVNDCLQTSFGPDIDNIWTCAICGSEAIVK